ncbi:MAG: enoyl-CoA hydratase/isomerase family protein [Candidatus Hydrogenedentes bacterium]|nr:enoyl-CoA hydratase/isomerase family protein [Candidatus Hydrogenedentota bacterium]
MNEFNFETIQCEMKGRTLRITLNRPKILNAINDIMLQEIRRALSWAVEHEEARAILIDAAGDRAFSAGIDVKWVGKFTGTESRESGRELHRTFLALRTTEMPIICAIDGLCLGAGLELALSCDIMIATDRSQFGLPNIDRGIPAIVEAAILPSAIGLQGAREMCFTGEFWSAEKAERRGLLHSVVTSENFQTEVESWCNKLSSKSVVGMATQKEIIHKWMTTDLESAIDFSINTVMLAFEAPDRKEAMAAFNEKRDAKLEGL